MARDRIMRHLVRFRKLYLVLALMLCLLVRWRFLNLCVVEDRGQVVLGMTNNLPPAFHYVSMPFLWLTDNLWYSPAFGNMMLAVLSCLLAYLIGKHVKDAGFGILMALSFALFPPAILVARFISPEQTELFFVLLISYLFMRLEVGDKLKGRARLLGLFTFFLAVVVGCFSKQQTGFIIFPLFIYGMWKHRLNIFRQEVYYVAALGIVPYCFFLMAHPEMLAAVVIYFVQPTGQMTVFSKFTELFMHYLSLALLYLIALVVLSVLWVRYRGWRRFTESGVFMLVMFLSYHLFLLKTLPRYFHLLALPLVYYAAVLIYTNRDVLFRILSFIALFLYCLLGFYFLVSGFSINTLGGCEQEIYGLEQNFIQAWWGEPPAKTTEFFREDMPDISGVLEGEKYLLIGGNTGQDFKYNVEQRLYYAGVMNSERYHDIDYAIITYPIDTTYTGAQAWDYPYLAFLMDHSEVVFDKDYPGHRRRVVLRISNHSTDGLEVGDFRTRSIEGLKLEGKV